MKPIYALGIVGGLAVAAYLVYDYVAGAQSAGSQSSGSGGTSSLTGGAGAPVAPIVVNVPLTDSAVPTSAGSGAPIINFPSNNTGVTPYPTAAPAPITSGGVLTGQQAAAANSLGKAQQLFGTANPPVQNTAPLPLTPANSATVAQTTAGLNALYASLGYTAPSAVATAPATTGGIAPPMTAKLPPALKLN